MYDISTLLVNGLPLSAVVFGLVEFIKSFGLKGRWLTIASMLLGLAFGVSYQIANAGIPVSFAGWFAVAVFGIMLGLVASGLYDFVDTRMPKG